MLPNTFLFTDFQSFPTALLQNLPFISNCRKQAGIQPDACIETFSGYEKTFNLVLVSIFSIDNLKVNGNAPADVQSNEY